MVLRSSMCSQNENEKKKKYVEHTTKLAYEGLVLLGVQKLQRHPKCIKGRSRKL